MTAGRRRLGVAVGVLLITAGLLHLVLEPSMRGVADLLSVEADVDSADLIFVLNGDLQTRPFLAADLYRRGFASRIGIPRPPVQPAERIGVLANGAHLAAEILRREGVPDSAIVFVPIQAANTFEEGAVLGDYVERHSLESVIVVTSEFHTRRARWSVMQHLPHDTIRVQMAGAPAVGYDESNWWLDEHGLVVVFNEYLKLFYYFWRY